MLCDFVSLKIIKLQSEIGGIKWTDLLQHYLC